MKTVLAVSCLLLSFIVSPAIAQLAPDALGSCLADSTSGKERKEMAKWVFMSMAGHPDMQGLSSIKSEERDATDKFVGLLFTQLFTERCPNQVKAAIASKGPIAVRDGFAYLGQIAMQELMTNKETGAAMAGFQKYIDQAKIKAVIEGK